MKVKSFKLFLICSCICSWICLCLWPLRDFALAGEEVKEPRRQKSPIKTIFTSFELGAGQLQSGGITTTDMGGELKVHYGLSDRWGLLGGIGRSASSANFQTSLYTSFQIGLDRSFGRPLIRYEEIQSLGKDEVVRKVDSFSGDLRLEMLVSLYLFNSNVSVVPFNALGIAVHYDFPSAKEWFYTGGVGYEYLSNSRRKLNSLRLIFGVFF